MLKFTWLAVLFALYAATKADGATLKPETTIRASVVRLGDLFQGAGGAADAEVDRAPAPGSRAVFDMPRLAEIARKHRLEWRPASRYDRVVVTREGRPIPRAEIEKQLGETLRRDALLDGDDIEVSIYGRALKAQAAPESDEPFWFEDVRYDPRSRRVTAVLAIPVDARNATRINLSGRADSVAEIPVLVRGVGRGEIVRRHDIAVRRFAKSQLRGNLLTDPQEIIGMAARRALRADKPLKASDLQAPVVVPRGALVTLSLRTAHMALTTRGRSLENGAKGETIRIVNLRSKRVVEGIVDGPGRVRVPDVGAQLAFRGDRS